MDEHLNAQLVLWQAADGEFGSFRSLGRDAKFGFVSQFWRSVGGPPDFLSGSRERITQSDAWALRAILLDENDAGPFEGALNFGNGPHCPRELISLGLDAFYGPDTHSCQIGQFQLSETQ